MSSPYRSDLGPALRRLLNGLKHTPATLARHLGVSADQLEGALAGTVPFTADLERALLTVTGINQRDLYPVERQADFPIVDDTVEGVRTCTAHATRATERTFTRGPGLPYYHYADTAMANASTFRPEWIQQLYVHDGNTAELPDWAFNKGHFEHQVTYFIGPVNFYWIDAQGRKRVRQMNTGDTNYIVPFVPHAFTTREAGEGLILAVTYGGALALPAFRARTAHASVEEMAREGEAPSEPVLFHLLAEEGRGVEDGFLAHVSVPHQRATRVRTFQAAADRLSFEEAVAADRWMYHLGGAPLELAWGNGRRTLLEPGDSAVLRPGVAHSLRAETAPAACLVIDIAPNEREISAELAAIQAHAGPSGLARVQAETTCWF